ncbi:MAG TPA: DNA polymerase domain-containing protein [Candidatus Diapherotrites archaeon]|nr:DNA polymerase domain-containing protein [Candidatus Diapherotrites archaeon]
MITKESIASVERIEQKEPLFVYDVEVDGNHMFFANDILVHNTDSMFLHIEPVLKSIYGDKYSAVDEDEKINTTLNIVKKCSEYINNHIIPELLNRHNAGNSKLATKYNFTFKEELIIKRAIFLEAKKKYALWIINKEGKKVDDLNITGMEVVRADFPRFTRNMLQDIIDKIMRKEYNSLQILSVIDKYIEEYKTELLKGNYTLGIPGGWGAREYKALTKVIRGMKIYNIIYGPTFYEGDRGYAFNIAKVDHSKIKDYDRKLKQMKAEGLLIKDDQIDVITIPEGTTLDTSIFYPDIDSMLELAIYRRLEPIVDIFNININHMDNLAW